MGRANEGGVRTGGGFNRELIGTFRVQIRNVWDDIRPT